MAANGEIEHGLSTGRVPDGPLPDGIDSKHVVRRHGLASSAGPILFLGGIMLTAWLGLFGGKGPDVLQSEGHVRELTVSMPLTLRSGMLFEMVIAVHAARDLEDAVIAFDPALWRGMTINTGIPAASEEKFEEGQFRLHYGPLGTGGRIELKIDGQLNPDLRGSNRGEVALLDGTRRIATIPVSVRVLP
jgi:hypothetical protein